MGDAAGQVDPLTGGLAPTAYIIVVDQGLFSGGIHYGLEAGKIAAETIVEGLDEGDLSERKMKVYQARWKRKFGFEFWLYVQPGYCTTCTNSNLFAAAVHGCYCTCCIGARFYWTQEPR